jgi:Uma2 family endonuclease
MATLVTDPQLEEQIRAQRAECGGDRFDEVWEGIYMMAPLPNSEHAEIQGGLVTAIRLAFGMSGPEKIYPGINVTDRSDDWTKNYRCPDIAVVLPDGIARDFGAFYLGGPDFATEIVSPDDRSREKISIYEKVGVRELLIIDRDPWQLEIYQLRDGRLELAGQSTVGHPSALQSSVLPVNFRLVRGETRPKIEVCHADGVQKWIV